MTDTPCGEKCPVPSDITTRLDGVEAGLSEVTAEVQILGAKVDAQGEASEAMLGLLQAREERTAKVLTAVTDWKTIAAVGGTLALIVALLLGTGLAGSWGDVGVALGESDARAGDVVEP